MPKFKMKTSIMSICIATSLLASSNDQITLEGKSKSDNIIDEAMQKFLKSNPLFKSSPVRNQIRQKKTKYQKPTTHNNISTGDSKYIGFNPNNTINNQPQRGESLDEYTYNRRKVVSSLYKKNYRFITIFFNQSNIDSLKYYKKNTSGIGLAYQSNYNDNVDFRYYFSHYFDVKYINKSIDSTTMTSFGADMLYNFNIDMPHLKPYALIGLGYSSIGEINYKDESSKPYLNIGAGLKLQIGVSTSLILEYDVKNNFPANEKILKIGFMIDVSKEDIKKPYIVKKEIVEY